MKVKDFLDKNQNKPKYQYGFAVRYEFVCSFKGDVRKKEINIPKDIIDHYLDCEIDYIEQDFIHTFAMDLKGNGIDKFMHYERAIIKTNDYLALNKQLKNSIKKINSYYTKKRYRSL